MYGQRGQCFFYQRLNQVCNLHIIDWWLPRDSQWNIQPGIFVNVAVTGSSALQFEWGAVAKRLFISENCWGLQPCKAVPALSCFSLRHALCNLPACYEHEVNKTLGHHKSQANDKSGAEIRQPEHSSGVQSKEASLSFCSLAAPFLLLGPNV